MHAAATQATRRWQPGFSGFCVLRFSEFTTEGTEATEDEPGSKLFLRRHRGVYLQPAATKPIPTIVKLRYNL
jgi:hypothetical protein